MLTLMITDLFTCHERIVSQTIDQSSHQRLSISRLSPGEGGDSVEHGVHTGDVVQALVGDDAGEESGKVSQHIDLALDQCLGEWRHHHLGVTTNVLPDEGDAHLGS